jgi:hypothetical protein
VRVHVRQQYWASQVRGKKSAEAADVVRDAEDTDKVEDSDAATAEEDAEAKDDDAAEEEAGFPLQVGKRLTPTRQTAPPMSAASH